MTDYERLLESGQMVPDMADQWVVLPADVARAVTREAARDRRERMAATIAPAVIDLFERIGMMRDHDDWREGVAMETRGLTDLILKELDATYRAPAARSSHAPVRGD